MFVCPSTKGPNQGCFVLAHSDKDDFVLVGCSYGHKHFKGEDFQTNPSPISLSNSGNLWWNAKRKYDGQKEWIILFERPTWPRTKNDPKSSRRCVSLFSEYQTVAYQQPGLNEDASASKNCRQQAVYVGVKKWCGKGGVIIQYHGMNAQKQRPNTVGYNYKTIQLIISEALPTIYYQLMISGNV